MSAKKIITQIKSSKYSLVPLAFLVAFSAQNGLSAHPSRNRIILAVVAAVLCVIYGLLRHKYPSFSMRWVFKQSGFIRDAGTAFYVMAFIAMSLGALNYYRFDSRNLLEERNYDDITYYYLNSKYFEELGYTNLYVAMLIADKEGPHRFSTIRQFRDLTNYEMKPLREAFKQTEAVKSHFSKERWAQFSHDLNFISGRWKGGDWHYLFSDHGYNPPPTWTLIGGFLSNICPVEVIKLIASIDILLVIVMFGVLLWAFGLDAFIFSFLFYVTTLSGHWPMAGQALLRFDWLAASVIGWSLFKKEKHTAAGAAFAYAGLIRLFPLVLFLPFGIAVLRDLIVERTIRRKYLKFIAGAAAMVILLTGGAFARYGADSFVASKEKMAMHAGPDSYSSQRVGLGDAMVFHGEVNRTEMNLRGGTLGKGEEIRNRMPYLYLIALCAIAFLTVFQLRSKEPEFVFAPLSIVLIFILTTPQVNYLNIRILLFAWSIYRFKSIRSTIGLVILFSLEAWAKYCDMTFLRYNATSWSSVGLTIYFAFIAISNAEEVLGHRFGKNAMEGVSEQFKRISPTVAMTAILAVLSVPHLLYRGIENTAFEPITANQEALSKVTHDGAKWNAPSHIVMKKDKGVLITLPERSHKQRLSISLDGNDRHMAAFFKDNTAVWSTRIGPRTGKGSGMKVYRIELPSKIAKNGIDAVRIVPLKGDDAYSIGHLIWLDKKNSNGLSR